jgi:hypothetical protein
VNAHAQYSPGLLTVMEAAVAPVLQEYDKPPLTVSTCDLPAQKVVGPAELMRALGAVVALFTTRTTEAMQPFVSVTTHV